VAGDIATISAGVGVRGGGEQDGWTVKGINERGARRCGVKGSRKSANIQSLNVSAYKPYSQNKINSVLKLCAAKY